MTCLRTGSRISPRSVMALKLRDGSSRVLARRRWKRSQVDCHRLAIRYRLATLLAWAAAERLVAVVFGTVGTVAAEAVALVVRAGIGACIVHSILHGGCFVDEGRISVGAVDEFGLGSAVRRRAQREVDVRFL